MIILELNPKTLGHVIHPYHRRRNAKQYDWSTIDVISPTRMVIGQPGYILRGQPPRDPCLGEDHVIHTRHSIRLTVLVVAAL